MKAKLQAFLISELYPRGKDITITIDGKLGEPQGWPGHSREEKIPASAGNRSDHPACVPLILILEVFMVVHN
jgi:hypothetical protein